MLVGRQKSVCCRRNHAWPFLYCCRCFALENIPCALYGGYERRTHLGARSRQVEGSRFYSIVQGRCTVLFAFGNGLPEARLYSPSSNGAWAARTRHVTRCIRAATSLLPASHLRLCRYWYPSNSVDDSWTAT